MKKLLQTLFLFFCAPLFAYRTIPVVAVDSALWSEIRIFEDWSYSDCQGSFVEYPEFVAPTIHYTLHFFDERQHKIELRLSRQNGELDFFAHVLDLTDFSENVIRIKKTSESARF